MQVIATVSSTQLFITDQFRAFDSSAERAQPTVPSNTLAEHRCNVVEEVLRSQVCVGEVCSRPTGVAECTDTVGVSAVLAKEVGADYACLYLLH